MHACIKILTGATTIHVGSGGMEGAEGSVQLVIKGDETQVKKAVEIIKSIKGTKLPPIPIPECITCTQKKCAHHGKKIDIDGRLIA